MNFIVEVNVFSETTINKGFPPRPEVRNIYVATFRSGRKGKVKEKGASATSGTVNPIERELPARPEAQSSSRACFRRGRKGEFFPAQASARAGRMNLKKLDYSYSAYVETHGTASDNPDTPYVETHGHASL